MDVKFYRCNHCGNLVMMVAGPGVPLVCCGEKMELLVPGAVDAAAEKHVPVVSAEPDAVRVEVGSVFHPMTEEHFIEWVALATEAGVNLKRLAPGDGPVAVFPPAEHGKVYAYCNLHGLWAAEF